jgi:hypothetical protein
MVTFMDSSDLLTSLSWTSLVGADCCAHCDNDCSTFDSGSIWFAECSFCLDCYATWVLNVYIWHQILFEKSNHGWKRANLVACWWTWIHDGSIYGESAAYQHQLACRTRIFCYLAPYGVSLIQRKLSRSLVLFRKQCCISCLFRRYPGIRN